MRLYSQTSMPVFVNRQTRRPTSASVQFKSLEAPKAPLVREPLTEYCITDYSASTLQVSPQNISPETRLANLEKEIHAIATEKRCPPDSLPIADELLKRAKFNFSGDEFRIMKALQIRQAHLGNKHPKVAEAHLRVAELYEANRVPQLHVQFQMSPGQYQQFNAISLKRLQVAREHFYQALPILESQGKKYENLTADIHFKLAKGYEYELIGNDYSTGMLKSAKRRFGNDVKFLEYAAKAENHFKKAYQVFQSKQYHNADRVRDCGNGLSYIYTITGKSKEQAVLAATFTSRHHQDQVSELKHKLRIAQSELKTALKEVTQSEKALGKTFHQLLDPNN